MTTNAPANISAHQNILFLCTGNSARSILAEMLLTRLSKGHLLGHSAGSTPTGTVNPHAVRLLNDLGYNTSNLRSKSWDEFAQAGAPSIHMVITVCDNAAGETCPIWPGHPARAHWSLPDPAAVKGSTREERAAFRQTYDALHQHIQNLLDALPEGKIIPVPANAKQSK